MSIPAGTTDPHRTAFPLPRLLAVAVAAAVLLAPAIGHAITRDEVLARAQTWVDREIPYSQVKSYKHYRTDCSGFTSMAWNTTRSGHPYSYTTRSLQSVSTVVTTDTIMPGDAMVRYDHHARVFYGWVDDTHTTYITYEQTGPHAQANIKNFAADVASGYVPRRYKKIQGFAPRWNSATNAGFDVWVYGTPIWWAPVGQPQAASLLRTSVAGGTVRDALRLVNASPRSRDVVGVSQSATITAGAPYRLSFAGSCSVPAALSVTLTFVDGRGVTLSTVTTAGVSWGVGAKATRRMSVTATAPALATRASYSIRLAGGTDASGSVGATAVVDDVWLNDPSPMASSLTLSSATTLRTHAVTLRGKVTGPVSTGSVRIRMTRPGTTKPYTVKTVGLSGGSWSLRFTPNTHGTYHFAAEYAGFGPFGPATSAVKALKVK